MQGAQYRVSTLAQRNNSFVLRVFTHTHLVRLFDKLPATQAARSYEFYECAKPIAARRVQHTFLDADSIPGIPLGQLTTVGNAANPITHGASFVSAHPIAALLTASVQHALLPVCSAVSVSTMRSIVSAVAVAAALSDAH
eukprot:4188-Heterococcus_DN1.PRE.2